MGEYMPENQTNNTTHDTQIDYLDEGVKYHNEKSALWKDMNAIAKLCSRQTGIDRNTLMKVKDYLHYRGRGWGDDCLSKSDESEKYPDRVSPTFRHLVDIVTNSYATGKEDLLNVYLDAVKEKGITISINESKFTRPTNENKQIVAEAIDQMDPIQCDICAKNDYMNDVLAEEAEAANLSPKDKYKKIVKLAAQKQAGRDVDDKVQDEYVKMELFQNGLEAVGDIQS
jgi:hypothetical protein